MYGRGNRKNVPRMMLATSLKGTNMYRVKGTNVDVEQAFTA